MTVRLIFKEIFETLANRSFVALFAGALLGAIATGLAAALAFYFYTYFWEFSSVQTGLITMGVFLAAVIGGLMAPVVTRRFGKKRGAMGVVEQAELKTGRRSEGVFFSTVTFVRKSVQGLGLLVASFVLAMAEFPAGATVEQVSDETVWRLGAYYVPTILVLWMSMIAVISMYKLSEEDHAENLRELRGGTQSQA